MPCSRVISSSWVPISAMRPPWDHHDAVGVPHGGQAVGDDEDRALLHQLGQRLLDQELALRVSCCPSSPVAHRTGRRITIETCGTSAASVPSAHGGR